VDRAQLSADDLARLAEVEPAFVERAMQAGALKNQELAGGFGIQDAARLRFLKAWDTAGLKVETIGDLIAQGELPFSFMDVPVMAAQPRLPSTYQDLCTQRGIGLSMVQQLHDALGFTPPAASDHVREDDLVVIELLRQLLAVGAEEAAALRLLRTYADALRRLTQAEADLYEAQVEEPLRQAGATEQDLLDTSGMTGAPSCHRCSNRRWWRSTGGTASTSGLTTRSAIWSASSRPRACTSVWTPHPLSVSWT
jgi:hypothetical protein